MYTTSKTQRARKLSTRGNHICEIEIRFYVCTYNLIILVALNKMEPRINYLRDIELFNHSREATHSVCCGLFIFFNKTSPYLLTVGLNVF